MILNATNGCIFSTGHRVARNNAVLWFLFESVRQGPDLAQLKNGGIMGIMGIRQDREPKKVVIVTEATSPLKDLKDAPRLGWDFG
jgi:hypothetical protein